MSAEGMIRTVLTTDYPQWPPMMPAGAVAAWVNETTAALAPQPLRPTVIGDLPVDVNSIDRLDVVLQATIARVANQDTEIAELRAALADAGPAIEYAAAHTERRALTNPGGPAVTKRWKAARREYDYHLARKDASDDFDLTK